MTHFHASRKCYRKPGYIEQNDPMNSILTKLQLLATALATSDFPGEPSAADRCAAPRTSTQTHDGPRACRPGSLVSCKSPSGKASGSYKWGGILGGCIASHGFLLDRRKDMQLTGSTGSSSPWHSTTFTLVMASSSASSPSPSV